MGALQSTEGIITIISILLFLGMVFHHQLSKKQAVELSEKRRLEAKYSHIELTLIKAVKMINFSFAVDGTIEEIPFLSLFRLVLSATMAEFARKKWDGERIKAFNVRDMQKYTQVFMESEQTRRNIFTKFVRLVETEFENISMEIFTTSQMIIAKSDSKGAMAEIEASLTKERLDKELVRRKGRDYCKKLFMDFQRKITDLNIRLSQLPPEKRQN